MASDAKPMDTAPSLFLRNATGLVKGWSGFDAFAYSFMSVNLVMPGHVLQPGDLRLRARRLGDRVDRASRRVGMTFMCIAYAGLIAVMPRAGGDYVWQTRILDGIPGAVRRWRVRRSSPMFLVGTALALGDVATYGGGGRSAPSSARPSA